MPSRRKRGTKGHFAFLTVELSVGGEQESEGAEISLLQEVLRPDASDVRIVQPDGREIPFSVGELAVGDVDEHGRRIRSCQGLHRVIGAGKGDNEAVVTDAVIARDIVCRESATGFLHMEPPVRPLAEEAQDSCKMLAV